MVRIRASRCDVRSGMSDSDELTLSVCVKTPASNWQHSVPSIGPEPWLPSKL